MGNGISLGTVALLAIAFIGISQFPHEVVNLLGSFVVGAGIVGGGVWLLFFA